MTNTWHRKVLHLLVAVVLTFTLATPVLAQQQNEPKSASNPLVRLLQSKGILSGEEAAAVMQAASPSESEQRLARLLLIKGLITQEDYDQTVGASVTNVAAEGSTGARVVPAVLRVKDPESAINVAAPVAPAAQAAGPKVIPGIVPIRVFPVDPPKREGIIPDIKIGPVRVKPYGFFKTTVIYDTSSPEGNDFPLPQFRVDTGPGAGKEFHIKARFLRVGSNFEWIDPSPKVAITGRLELDFEGNFSRVANRNISTIRSSAPQIRLAWGRVDYALTDTTTIHALFGQDWTPFASSTLPNLLESTGLGLAYGTLYERAPQFRLGVTHNFGGSWSFKLQPEVAAVLPSFGNLPGAVGALTGVEQQLAFGERQGVDSGRPEVQGRLVAQFQLDKAPGVAPAQLIVSGMQGRREAVVTRAAVLTLPAAFQAAFPTGAKVDSSRAGYTAEVQLPTRYATLIAKYWNGEDLRFYFGGQFASNYNDFNGLFSTVGGVCVASTAANTSTVASVDNSSAVAFAFTDAACTTPTRVPQRPVRAQGGFVNVGFPLSRIFGADPEGRNNGWSLYLHYGIDEAKARDVRRTGIRSSRGDLAAGTLFYKLNNWVSFAFEQSLYVTRTPNPASLATPFRGIPAREARNLRSEFGTIFTF